MRFPHGWFRRFEHTIYFRHQLSLLEGDRLSETTAQSTFKHRTRAGLQRQPGIVATPQVARASVIGEQNNTADINFSIRPQPPFTP
jgi:hypothetical protein